MESPLVESIRWRDGALWLQDQPALPSREDWLEISGADEAARAIRDPVVRGAPAIGISAAYVAVMAARARGDDPEGWFDDLDGSARSRPTAVNLRWAVDRMRGPALRRCSAGFPAQPEGIATYDPVFDVTPSELIDAIVTDRGVLEPPFEGRVAPPSVIAGASEHGRFRPPVW